MEEIMDEILRKMNAVSWVYADKDPAALEILEQRIAEAGRDENKLTVTYSNLVRGVKFHLPNIRNGEAYEIRTFDWSGLDRALIGEFLGYISKRSYEKAKFMASSLVVMSEEMRPSPHFFEWMKKLGILPSLDEGTVTKFWLEQVNKAHDYYKSYLS
jgi:hypothetical protein